MTFCSVLSLSLLVGILPDSAVWPVRYTFKRYDTTIGVPLTVPGMLGYGILACLSIRGIRRTQVSVVANQGLAF